MKDQAKTKEQLIDELIELRKRNDELVFIKSEFQSISELISDGILNSDFKGTITSCNTAFFSLTGFSKDEIVGKHFSKLPTISMRDLPKYIKIMKSILMGKTPKPFEFIWIHKDGKERWGEAYVRVVKHDRKIIGLQAVLKDITERKEAEEEIRRNLKEKEVLLQEIHHRVKNNLQIISSLLRLQSRSIKDKDVLDKFNVSQNRIKSMSLIHENLYRSESLGKIDFSSYLNQITTHLFSVYSAEASGIDLKLDIARVILDINKAIPCSLIINELISNALKHAFPGKNKGEIKIKMHVDEQDKVSLIIMDTGIGLTKEPDLCKPETLGMQIVSDLVRQLKGTFELSSKDGTAWKIMF